MPTGTVRLSIDYQNLQKNFQQLDTTFGVDHTTFSNQTAQNGYHKAIHLIPQAAPAATAGYGQLFSTTVTDVNNDQALFFLTGGNRLLKLTMNFVPVSATNGYTFLPGGLIFQWGVVNAPGSTGTVTFSTANIAFPNNCFNVSLTVRRNASSSTQGMYINGLPTTTQFQFNGSSAPDNLYWIAIGN